jgi:hypothetical protein
VITAADVLSLISTARVGPYRRYALVLDLRAATLTLTRAEMQEFATRSNALHETEGPGGPVAIVADRPGAAALARIYETLVERRALPPLRIFATDADADEWLATLE